MSTSVKVFISISTILIGLLIVSIIYFVSPSPSQVEDITNLTSVHSFPDENDGVFLQYPNMLEMDEEGYIYVNDQPQSHITKFDSTGRFIEFIGSPGKGPGEFTRQLQFCYADEKLFVGDQGNRRIQIFNKQGESIKSFLYPHTYSSLTCYNGKIYLFLLNVETEGNDLITVIDTAGNQINKFGRYLHIFDNQPPAASEPILKIFKNRLYVLHHYYPILQVFNLNGELLHRFEWEKMGYNKLVPENYDHGSFSNPGGMGTKYLFRAMDVNKKGIFVGLYNSELIIDQFDFKGNFINRYRYKKVSENFYLFDFIIKNINKKMHFLVLNRNNDYKITIYK